MSMGRAGSAPSLCNNSSSERRANSIRREKREPKREVFDHQTEPALLHLLYSATTRPAKRANSNRREKREAKREAFDH